MAFGKAWREWIIKILTYLVFAPYKTLCFQLGEGSQKWVKFQSHGYPIYFHWEKHSRIRFKVRRKGLGEADFQLLLSLLA